MTTSFEDLRGQESDPRPADRPSDLLDGIRVAALVSNEGIEEAELTVPMQALRAVGATVEIVAPRSGEVQTYRHLDRVGSYPVDCELGTADPARYAALLIPGGVANADQLRTETRAVAIVEQFVRLGLPTAVICHGPWLLVEAGVLDGVTITSWPSLATDVRNAGGRWVDQQVCRDGAIVTSRKPDDLDAFCDAFIDLIASAGRAEAARAA